MQEMDPAKASQLEAAMQQSADSAAVQPDAQLTAPPAPLPQGDADAALPNRAMPKDRLRLTKPAPTKQDSHVSLGIPSAPPGVHGSGTSDAQQPKQATQKQTNHNAKGVGQLNADGSVTQASSVSATDTNRITEQASATASSPPVDAQLSEPDTQLSISPGSKVSPDQDPPSRGKSDNTAGKSETHWADEGRVLSQHMLCRAMLWHALLCCATPCCAMPCHAMLKQTVNRCCVVGKGAEEQVDQCR